MAYISSFSKKLKKSMSPDIVQATTREQLEQRKSTMLEVLDKSLNEFVLLLSKGKIPIKNTLDLERIIKLTLLVSGEANERQGIEASTSEEEIEQIGRTELETVKDLLKTNDPSVQALKNKLIEALNNKNDEF
jgi:hypothetical protein